MFRLNNMGWKMVTNRAV